MRDWIRRHDTPGARLDALVIIAVIFVTMWELHPSLIFSNTLITGGDTGSHLAVPAYLKSVGNPST